MTTMTTTTTTTMTTTTMIKITSWLPVSNLPAPFRPPSKPPEETCVLSSTPDHCGKRSPPPRSLSCSPPRRSAGPPQSECSVSRAACPTSPPESQRCSQSPNPGWRSPEKSLVLSSFERETSILALSATTLSQEVDGVEEGSTNRSKFTCTKFYQFYTFQSNSLLSLVVVEILTFNNWWIQIQNVFN